jgi:sarcosine oxidase subunit beta
MKKGRPHIIIIGGGVIGASMAFFLSRADARVTLIEKDDPASGSSGACDGLVFLQSKRPGVHLTMALESLTLFESLQAKLPGDIEFRQSGGMVVIETDAEMRSMETYVRAQRETGLDVRLLDKDQALELEPNLSPGIKGCAFSPLDAQVNPINLTLGFVREARKNHAAVMTRTEVLGILAKGSTVTGVRTDRGEIRGDMVVNAAGALAGRVCRMLDIPVPITPRRGQIVVTGATRPVLRHCLISAGYIAAKYDPSPADQAGQGISMEQTGNGNLLLGSTREFAGFNRQTTLSGIRTILRQTTSVVPCIEHLQVIRTFAGLRPYTPDGLPLLGPVRGVNGFFMAAGHEGDGIALSPVTGRLMADLLLEKQVSIPLEAFSPDRFQDREGNCHERD